MEETMKKFLLTLCFSGLILGAFAAAGLSQTAKHIPVKDFFRNPEKFYYQLSPDGKHVSFMQPYQKRQNVFIQAVGSKDEIRITSETERDISQYLWKGNHRIIYFRDFSGDENFHLFSGDTREKNFKDLTPFEKVQVQ